MNLAQNTAPIRIWILISAWDFPKGADVGAARTSLKDFERITGSYGRRRHVGQDPGPRQLKAGGDCQTPV